MDPCKLYNLASGRPAEDDVAENLLTVSDRGVSLRNDFLNRVRLEDKNGQGTAKIFFDPIKRAPWKSFTDTKKKSKVNTKRQTKDVAVQRDILGLLAASSQKNNESVNIDEALSFPLTEVPLCLATSDGIRRKNAKSKLFDAALTSLEVERDSAELSYDGISCYMLDLAAALCCIGKPPDTFIKLAMRILYAIPAQMTLYT